MENASAGLAKVGTRAALNFSFAFLRRAWRSGQYFFKLISFNQELNNPTINVLFFGCLCIELSLIHLSGLGESKGNFNL